MSSANVTGLKTLWHKWPLENLLWHIKTKLSLSNEFPLPCSQIYPLAHGLTFIIHTTSPPQTNSAKHENRIQQGARGYTLSMALLLRYSETIVPKLVKTRNMITRHVVGHLRSRHIHVAFAETNQGQAHQNSHWATHEVIDTNHKTSTLHLMS